MTDDVDLSRLMDACTDAAQAECIQRDYLRWFAEGARVLDVGCGRGGFLDVLAASGRTGVGVDRSEAALRDCRLRGHTIEDGDASAALAKLRARGEKFDGALLAHVIEHLHGQEAVVLLRAVASVLAAGAVLVVATPNFKNQIVANELFWFDPTHVRPYPRAVIERMGAAVGFEVVLSYDDPLTRPRRSVWRQIVATVRCWLGGVDRVSPLDAVVVLRRR